MQVFYVDWNGIFVPVLRIAKHVTKVLLDIQPVSRTMNIRRYQSSESLAVALEMLNTLGQDVKRKVDVEALNSYNQADCQCSSGAEQRFRKPPVVGSNPTAGSIFG